MRPLLALTLTLVLSTLASAATAAEPRAAAAAPASLQKAFDETLAAAAGAIERYGVTDSAMVRIQAALARLATQPSLRDQAKLQQIHGSPTSNAALLASRGVDSLSLFLARFQPGHATPVHDHQTWGVLYVLEGRDHYVHYSVDYSPGDHARADVRMATGTLLVPGSSLYWFPPPHDLHSQEAMDGTVWELVLAGRDFLSPEVMGHRHYFDPRTGGVSSTPPR